MSRVTIVKLFLLLLTAAACEVPAMVSAAINPSGNRAKGPNWGMSTLVADLHSGNRREVARAEFEDPREVTVTFSLTDMLSVEQREMHVQAELHIGAGAIAYTVPVDLSARGTVMHVTCKTISVRLYSDNYAAVAATLARKARWNVGIALGQSIKQPPRLSTVGPVGNTGTYQGGGGATAFFLRPWTTAIQLIPVRNGSIPVPDASLVYVKEVHSIGPADAFPPQTQYEWQGLRALDTPMPLHHNTTALQFRNTNTNDPNAYFHLIEHWQL